MKPETSIASQVYCETLCKMRRTIQNRRRGMLRLGIVLYDNARLHKAACTIETIRKFGWEIFYNSSYSADLSPSDYHLDFYTSKTGLCPNNSRKVKNWKFRCRSATISGGRILCSGFKEAFFSISKAFGDYVIQWLCTLIK